VRAKLNELLAPHLDRPVKAAVLGCTHYVFIKSALRAVLPESVTLVDGNRGTVRQLRNRLAQKDLLREGSGGGNVVFLSTANGNAIPDRMREWFHKALPALDPACISPDDAVE
jgi:glutamate racemase